MNTQPLNLPRCFSPTLISIFTFILLSVWNYSAGAQTFVSRNLAGTSSTSFQLGSTSAKKTQQLYTPVELGLPVVTGNIDKVYFMYNSTAAQTFTDLEVYIWQSAATFIGTNFYTPPGPPNFSGSFTIPAGTAGDWFEIPLTNPFFGYDPSLSVIVETRWDVNPTSTTWAVRTGASDPTGTNRKVYANNITAPAGTATTTRANFGFDVVPGSPDDAGITSIDAPVSPAIPGVQNVFVTLRNFGTDTLESVNIHWEVDGAGQTTYNWTGSLESAGIETNINIGSFSFVDGTHQITAWTSDPNGNTDGNTNNDTATVSVIFCAPLAGNYTIDAALPSGGTNFQSFNEFAARINICGVSADVTVTVATGSGPYNEQVVFEGIPGIGASATVTIEGNGETISALTNTTDRHIIRLTDLSYFNLNNLRIEIDTSTPTQFYGVHIFNSGSFINVTNCTIDISGNTSTLAGAVVLSGSTTSILTNGTYDNINISNNTTTGGGYGVSVYGFSTGGLRASNISIIDNEITGTASNSIYLFANDGTIVRGNNINFSAGNGIQIAQTANINCLVEKNVVSCNNPTSGGTFRGIYVFGNNFFSSNRVVNNLVWNMNAPAAIIIGIDSRAGGEYYFNTVILDDTSATGTFTAGFNEDLSNTNSDLKNNLFYVTRSSSNYSTAIALAGTSTVTTTLNSNFNAFYVSNGAHFAVRKGTLTSSPPATIYANLSEWQTASTQDSSSYETDPFFESPTLPRPTSGIINDKGTPIAGVVDDITGATGNRTTTPDPGAFEFSPAADDAAITAFIAPATPFCAAMLDVEFELTNSGSSTLDSVTIDWEVNSVPQTPVQLSGLGLVSGASVIVTLGAVSVTDNTLYTFTAASSNPNGSPDSNPSNDSFTFTGWRKGFIGAYTINNNAAASATNYTSFQSISNDLSAYGACGPVTIDVDAASNTYTEQAVFNPIPGTDNNNTVAINGNGQTIEFNPTQAVSDHLIKLDGIQYFTLNNLRIVSLHATNGRGIFITNDASFINITNNTIEVSKTATGSTTFGILAGGANWLLDGSLSRNLNISGNTVTGGYSCIQLNGELWNNPLQLSDVTDNTLLDFYGYGIYLNYTQNVKVVNNSISRPTRTNSGSDSQTPAGIIASAGNRGFVIDKNRVFNLSENMTGSELLKISRGIYVSGTTTAPSFGNIQNNLVYGFTNSASQYGIQNNSTVGPVNIYHNTVALNDVNSMATSTYITVAMQLSNSSAQTNCDIRNNIFSITRGGASNKRVIEASSASTIFTSDNNVLYLNSTSGVNNIGKIGTSTFYATLADWQTGTAKDSNSVSTAPLFTDESNGDFTPTAAAANNIGVFVNVADDITGAARDTVNPDPGAYEFDVCTLPPPPAAINGNVQVCSEATGVNYDATPVAGAFNYEWTVPAGATIVSGQGTTAITVDFGTTEGDISVTAEDSCGVSATATTIGVTFLSLPATPGAITGDDEFCVGESGAFSIDPVAGADTYSWLIPSGTISSGQGTNAITADLGNTGGTVGVTANNSCGSSQTATLDIIVNALPTVTLSLPADTLCSVASPLTLSGGSPAGGDYSGNGVLNNEFNPGTGAGNYTITYFYTDGNGCSESATDVITVEICPGIRFTESIEWQVYPNPFETQVTVQINSMLNNLTIELYDAVGRQVRSYADVQQQLNIQRNELQSGLYQLVVKSDNEIVGRKKLIVH